MVHAAHLSHGAGFTSATPALTICRLRPGRGPAPVASRWPAPPRSFGSSPAKQQRPAQLVPNRERRFRSPGIRTPVLLRQVSHSRLVGVWPKWDARYTSVLRISSSPRYNGPRRGSQTRHMLKPSGLVGSAYDHRRTTPHRSQGRITLTPLSSYVPEVGELCGSPQSPSAQENDRQREDVSDWNTNHPSVEGYGGDESDDPNDFGCYHAGPIRIFGHATNSKVEPHAGSARGMSSGSI